MVKALASSPAIFPPFFGLAACGKAPRINSGQYSLAFPRRPGQPCGRMNPVPVPSRISTFYSENNQKTIGLTSISSAVKSKNNQFLLRASEFRLLGILSSALRGIGGAPRQDRWWGRGGCISIRPFTRQSRFYKSRKRTRLPSFHQGFLALAGSQ